MLPLTAALAFAQQPTQDENSTQWSPVTLAGEFLEHDFVNWFAYTDGVYDSYAPISSSNGRITNNGSFGWEIGAGVSASHAIQNGNFSISYRGDYRDYQNGFYGTGTDQNLGISFVKRLSRRWTLSASLGGGIAFYGGTVLSNTPDATNILTNNPFATETKYLATGVTMSYQQSRRLSYVVGGNYFLQRYNYAGAIGSAGVSASGSVFYRTSIRTTVGGTYSHSYFNFQRGVGTENGDTIQASISHVFPNHWNASVAGGVTRSNMSGTSIFAASLLFPGLNLGPGLYVAERFNETTSFPSFSGTVSRNFRHSNFYATRRAGTQCRKRILSCFEGALLQRALLCCHQQAPECQRQRRRIPPQQRR